MAWEEMVFSIFVLVGTINLLHLGLYIGGANIYDMWQFRRLSRQPKRLWQKRPLVSVVVPAHNEELVVARCLDSIRRSSYSRLQVVVHNDNSTDNTAALVRAYQKRYKNFDLRLVNRRHQAGKAGGVNYCIKRYAKGSLIMTLDADSVLRPDTIGNAVKYFKDPRVAGVAANVRIMDSSTILGLLQKFEHLIGYRSKKFYMMANCEFIVGGVASTYRANIMRQVKLYDTDTQTEDIGLSMKIVAAGNRDNRIVYAADVVATTEGVQTFKALLKQRYRWKLGSLQNLLKHKSLAGNINRRYSWALTFYRIPMAFFSEFMLLLQPFILAYVAYLSFVYDTPQLFVGAYMTITLYVLWNIWPDEHSSWIQKLKMSIYAPIIYFVFYIMDAVQVIAIVRCLSQPSKLALKGSKTGGHWVSPERSGQAA